MNMWLVGAGYWGSKLKASLDMFGVECQIVDIRNGQTIDDIDTQDPVILATPLWQHYDQVMQLLDRGHDVYVEKPAAETLSQVIKMQSIIRPDQLFMVGHIFQHHPQMDQIKLMIQRGDIGSLIHVNSRRLNWGIYQTRTDPVLSLATHDISIVLAAVGQAETVITGVQHWKHSDNVMPDRVMFQGRTGSVTFDIDVSWAWPVRTRQTVFVGEQGQILWDQDANTITVYGNQIVDRRAVTDLAPKVINYDSELTPLQHELQHWVECVRTRRSPATGIHEARAVAQVIDQVRSGLV